MTPFLESQLSSKEHFVAYIVCVPLITFTMEQLTWGSCPCKIIALTPTYSKSYSPPQKRDWLKLDSYHGEAVLEGSEQIFCTRWDDMENLFLSIYALNWEYVHMKGKWNWHSPTVKCQFSSVLWEYLLRNALNRIWTKPCVINSVECKFICIIPTAILRKSIWNHSQ